MSGFLSIILHAHLPFVRHPEHERFLEESWLFEAITETYVPLLQVMQGWLTDGARARLTLSLSPTLCSMLQDELLQDRYSRYLERLVELAERETSRTMLEPAFERLANMYRDRLRSIHRTYLAYDRDLVRAFANFQEVGLIEIITTAATHAVLPLLSKHPESLRAQVLVARDHYRQCFGSNPQGIWLPECAYAAEVEPALSEAGIRWFTLDSHGILHANPRPRYGVYAPLVTPRGLAAFGRDIESARQVWSREEGYPGDVRYRDFYRDIGFDLEFDYLRSYLPTGDVRGYTGIKYYAITGPGRDKKVYDRDAALKAAEDHAGHFVAARAAQMRKLGAVIDRPAVVVSPYDAELFGHWWYEGPEFLDFVVRTAWRDQRDFTMVTPSEFLGLHPVHQSARPGASSWGEGGYWDVWLNEETKWIYPHLDAAQRRMCELARQFPRVEGLRKRALQQAGRELMLAQSSDWPFIVRTRTSPEYARKRVESHLLRFLSLYEQLTTGNIDEPGLEKLEAADNLFPDLKYEYWA